MQTVHVLDKYQGPRPEIVVHDTETPSLEARLAIVLVERWGMVSGADDGEDAAGRSKMRLLTPEEVVARACETAETLTATLRSKGWFIKVPGFDEAFELAAQSRKDAEEKEEAERVRRAADRAAAKQAT